MPSNERADIEDAVRPLVGLGNNPPIIERPDEDWFSEVTSKLDIERVLRRAHLRNRRIREAEIVDREIRKSANLIVNRDFSQAEWRSVVDNLTSDDGEIAAAVRRRSANIYFIVFGLLLIIVGLITYSLPGVSGTSTGPTIDWHWSVLVLLLLAFVAFTTAVWYAVGQRASDWGPKRISNVNDSGGSSRASVGFWIRYWLWFLFMRMGLPIALVLVLIVFGLSRDAVSGKYVVAIAIVALFAGVVFAVVDLARDPWRNPFGFDGYPAPFPLRERRSSAETISLFYELAYRRARRERRNAHWWLMVFIVLAALATLSAGGAGVIAVGTPEPWPSIVPALALIGAAAVGLSTALNPGNAWKMAGQRAKDIEALVRELQVMHDLDGDDYKNRGKDREAVEYVLNKLDAILGSTPGMTSHWAEQQPPLVAPNR